MLNTWNTGASGNLLLWKKHQEMVNRNQVSLHLTITKVFSSFPTQMNEKERHIPMFALYFPALKLWDGFWLLSIPYCLASPQTRDERNVSRSAPVTACHTRTQRANPCSSL